MCLPKFFKFKFVENFEKYIPKFMFKAKKTSKNVFRSLKLGAEKEIRGGEEVWGVG
jgi:hypothetical protein